MLDIMWDPRFTSISSSDLKILFSAVVHWLRRFLQRFLKEIRQFERTSSWLCESRLCPCAFTCCTAIKFGLFEDFTASFVISTDVVCYNVFSFKIYGVEITSLSVNGKVSALLFLRRWSASCGTPTSVSHKERWVQSLISLSHSLYHEGALI